MARRFTGIFGAVIVLMLAVSLDGWMEPLGAIDSVPSNPASSTIVVTTVDFDPALLSLEEFAD